MSGSTLTAPELPSRRFGLALLLAVLGLLVGWPVAGASAAATGQTDFIYDTSAAPDSLGSSSVLWCTSAYRSSGGLDASDRVPSVRLRPVVDLSAPRTTSLVARGSDVSGDTIQSALRGADLQTTQSAVSLPRVQRYVDRILAGEMPPAIKVDGTRIVDGNHRYIASRITGVDIDIQPWPGSSRPVVPWDDLVVDVADWAD